MASGKENNLKIAILTVSTSCYYGNRRDASGDILEEICKQNNFIIAIRDLVPDNKKIISKRLKKFADKLKVDVVFTTGGTGLGPYDFTPEATKRVCSKIIDNFKFLILSEAIKKTKKAVFSRGISGVRKKTLIINLPGSPKAVEENLSIVVELIPHAIHIINGGGH